MDNEIDVRKGRHCVFDLHVHLVFVTKYRHKVFTDKHLTRLETIFHDVCENFNCRLEEFNGETDHVHLLISFPPTVELARLVNSLKGVSSRYMRRDYPELAQHYWRAKRLWSGSYYAGTAGGAPLHTLKNYIENQTDQPIKKERRRRFTPVLKDRVPASKHDGKRAAVYSRTRLLRNMLHSYDVCLVLPTHTGSMTQSLTLSSWIEVN